MRSVMLNTNTVGAMSLLEKVFSGASPEGPAYCHGRMRTTYSYSSSMLSMPASQRQNPICVSRIVSSARSSPDFGLIHRHRNSARGIARPDR